MPSPTPHVVVAGHACIDIIPEFPARSGGGGQRIVPGQLTITGPAQVSPGGVVSNTGLALHKLGVSTSLLGKVGDDMFGRALLEILAAQSPRLSRDMIVAAGENTSYSIVVSPPGVDRAFLHCPGANDTYCADDIPVASLEGASLLHFGYPTLMQRIYSDGGRQLRKLFDQAHSHGVVTSLDMSMPDPLAPAGQVDWRSWLREVLPAVDVFLPSFDEILFMLDRQEFDRRQLPASDSSLERLDVELLRRLTGELLNWGVCIAGLKLGEQGLYLRTAENVSTLGARLGVTASADAFAAKWSGCELLSPCFVVEPVGTTGAGDATMAGFLAALVSGVSPAEAAVQAVGVGACCVESADATAGIRTLDATAARIAANWPRRRSDEPAENWRWEPLDGVWQPSCV